MARPIDKTYLVSALKSFDEQVLKKKYSSSTSETGGKSVQCDWNETNTTSDAFIKNKPIIPEAYDDTALIQRVSDIEIDYAKASDIPTITNDLTDELKSSYDSAVIDKHTHSNKTTIDKISESSDGVLLFDGNEIKGSTPEFSIGTITTLNDGSNATASISGTAENPVLNLGIPQGKSGATGATGKTGATPNLQIGTVTTLEAGSDASASISGTAENPILNLNIPKGLIGGNLYQEDLWSGSTSASPTSVTLANSYKNYEFIGFYGSAINSAGSTDMFGIYPVSCINQNVPITIPNWVDFFANGNAFQMNFLFTSEKTMELYPISAGIYSMYIKKIIGFKTEPTETLLWSGAITSDFGSVARETITIDSYDKYKILKFFGYGIVADGSCFTWCSEVTTSSIIQSSASATGSSLYEYILFHWGSTNDSFQVDCRFISKTELWLWLSGTSNWGVRISKIYGYK